MLFIYFLFLIEFMSIVSGKSSTINLVPFAKKWNAQIINFILTYLVRGWRQSQLNLLNKSHIKKWGERERMRDREREKEGEKERKREREGERERGRKRERERRKHRERESGRERERGRKGERERSVVPYPLARGSCRPPTPPQPGTPPYIALYVLKYVSENLDISKHQAQYRVHCIRC